ncbi:hypothetical protein, partial [Rhizobium sp.]|uniref:hypothetical protein n=1 Tax=Rhizobium sp. TaxID=391 RepID=UPI002AA81B75
LFTATGFSAKQAHNPASIDPLFHPTDPSAARPRDNPLALFYFLLPQHKFDACQKNRLVIHQMNN